MQESKTPLVPKTHRTGPPGGPGGESLKPSSSDESCQGAEHPDRAPLVPRCGTGRPTVRLEGTGDDKLRMVRCETLQGFTRPSLVGF